MSSPQYLLLKKMNTFLNLEPHVHVLFCFNLDYAGHSRVSSGWLHGDEGCNNVLVQGAYHCICINHGRSNVNINPLCLSAVLGYNSTVKSTRCSPTYCEVTIKEVHLVCLGLATESSLYLDIHTAACQQYCCMSWRINTHWACLNLYLHFLWVYLDRLRCARVWSLLAGWWGIIISEWREVEDDWSVSGLLPGLTSV